MAEAKNEHSIEERLELSLLYDFYGALLKDNQRRMFEASVLEDYNLSEIAEDEGITRQGVHDAIKRASNQLRTYEEKLGLVARFEYHNKLMKKLKKGVNDTIQSGNLDNLKEITKILDEFIMEE